jgi:Protein of unknown function (DUF3562)
MPVHHKPLDQKRIVALLANESHVPIDDVATLYEHERAELALVARNTNFLHIFAIRNVQEILRKRSVDKKALTATGSARLAA